MKSRNTYIKISSIFLIVAILISIVSISIVASNAAEMSGTCGDNATWVLDSEGTLTISGTGAIRNYSSNSSPFYNRTDIKRVLIEFGISSLGNYAFQNCTSLTSITIPDSVTSIGEWAFSGCTSLTSITIPDSVTLIAEGTFSDCKSLTSITIPDSVTSIGSAAFQGCSSLTSVTIPDSVTSIGKHAFIDCSSLTSVTIPNSVTTIDSAAFWGCSSLTSVMIPDSVTTIGNHAFLDCSSLTSVTIPNSVTSIGIAAFSGCESLTSVTIPNSVTSIGECAFSDCESLTSVTIPNSVTAIGNYAFLQCYSLTSVTISDSVTSIGEETFMNCRSLTSVTIPNSVTTIGNYAFYDCRSLTSVTIPDSVTTIGSAAFSNCRSLTSVTIPDSVTSIGERAFSDCKSLTSVAIGNSVMSIGDGAFSGCKKVSIDCSRNQYAEQWCIDNNYVHAFTPKEHVYSSSWILMLEAVDTNNKPVEADQMKSMFESSLNVSFEETGKNYFGLYDNAVWSQFNNVVGIDGTDTLATDYTYLPYILNQLGVTATTKAVRFTHNNFSDGGLFTNDYTVVNDPSEANGVLVTYVDDTAQRVNKDITQSGNDGTSIVTLDYTPAVFNVTVPTVLPVNVDSDNNVTVADDAQIINNCNGSVEVTNATISGQSEWALVAFDTDFSEVPVDSKQYGFKIQDNDVYDGIDASEFDVIEGKSTLPITYDANVAIQSNAIEGADIGHIVFTIGWSK